MSLPAGLPERESINAKPWRRCVPPSRVLAIRIEAMGDTVATFPYLWALRRRLPSIELDFVTRADYAELPNSVELADKVFVVPRQRLRAQLFSALRLLPQLWARRYDVVIDLQRNPTSRFIRRSLVARAWSEFDRFSPMLAGERYRRTIEATGLGSLDVIPDLRLREPDLGREKLLTAGWDAATELVVLNPGGAVADRQWHLDRYIAFAERFATTCPRPVTFVVLGIPKMRDKAAAIRAALGDQVLNLVGETSLTEAVGIVHRASLMVSEDAGLMHVAWVLGVPTVGVFGASRSVWARPHGNYCRLVLACPEPDGVCMDGRCRRGPPSCLSGLSVEGVYQAALATRRPPAGGNVIARGGVPVFPEDVKV